MARNIYLLPITGNYMTYPDGDIAHPQVQERGWELNPFNFDDVPNGLLTLFTVATFEGKFGFLTTHSVIERKIQNSDGDIVISYLQLYLVWPRHWILILKKRLWIKKTVRICHYDALLTRPFYAQEFKYKKFIVVIMIQPRENSQEFFNEFITIFTQENRSFAYKIHFSQSK